MKHATMEELLLLNLNDKIWSDIEREDIIEKAVDNYLKKRRVTKQTSVGPPEKRFRLDKEEKEESCSEESFSSGSESDDKRY